MPVYGDSRSGTISALPGVYGGIVQGATPGGALYPVTAPKIVAGSNPKIDTLTADFTAADTVRWYYGPSASATGGQLVETCTSTYAGEIVTWDRYDLTGTAAFIQLVQRANLGNGGTSSYLALDSTASANSNTVYFSVEGVNLVAVRIVAGAYTTVNFTAYDAAVHRWLRIRESAGTIFWDYSADGSTWTNLASWVATFTFGSTSVRIGTGYGGTEPTPGTAIWDNFNVPPPPGAPATASGSIALDGSATASAASSTAGAVSLGGTATPGARATGAGSITLGGTGSPAAPVTAAGSITLGGSGTARAAATVAGTVTLGGTATAQAAATSTGTVTLSGTASPQAPTTATGGITLTGTPTATAPATAAGSVTLGGAATARAATAAAGTITLAGTATATQPGSSATGTITLSGTATARAATAATGSLTLTGTVTARASATASGAVVLGGTVSGQAATSSSGTVVLGGSATALVPATVAGLITLSGLATGAAVGAYRDITLTVGPGRSRTLGVTATARSLTAAGTGSRTVTATGTSRELTAAGTSRTLTAEPLE